MIRTIRPLFFAAATALLGVTPQAQLEPEGIQARVDTIFSRWTPATPGCAVGADVKGQPVVRRVYGMADLEHDVPITADTIFEAASVSKQFTAAAVLLLARDGKLSLDDAVRRYIPELPPSASAVTIRQMLQHTAGLRDWGYLTALAGSPRGTRMQTQDGVLDIISRQRALNFPSGTNWSYSNSGYSLAPILVARVSGTSFQEFTRTRIFAPLGMDDTSWRDDWKRVVKRRAIGHIERQGTFEIEMPFENVIGNGGMLTTVGDLLKWNANFERPVVGDATFVAELQRRATFNDGRTHEYALGLYVDTYRGVAEVDHSGGGLGYSAHLGRYPEQHISVAVLCNVANANPTASAKAVAGLFLTGLRVADPPEASHSLTAAEGTRLAGLYRSTQPAGLATVVYEKGALLVQNVARLIPTSATVFVTSDSFTYEFDGRGGMRATDEFGTAVSYDRVEPAKPTVAQLKAFTGRFVNDEVETTLDVAVEGSELIVRRQPALRVALRPVYADAFSGALGWVIFRRDSAGRIVGLSISQDRMWDMPFARQAELR